MLGTELCYAVFGVCVGQGRPVPERVLARIEQASLRHFEAFGPQPVSVAAVVGGGGEREAAWSFTRTARGAAMRSAFWGRQLAGVRRPVVADVKVLSRGVLAERGRELLCRGARPVFTCKSSGTTGRPVQTWISADELSLLTTLNVLGLLRGGRVMPGDRVMIATAPGIGTHGLAVACARIGATVELIDTRAAGEMLDRLMRAPRTTVLSACPSSLAGVAEAARERHLNARALSLRTILTGGEILTDALRRRVEQTLGAEVVEGYAGSETTPMGGAVCEDGHLHFDASRGLIEVLDPDGSDESVDPGQIGRLILTPFAPFRHTTPVLRYDTEDLVCVLTERPTCSMAAAPATSRPLGKQAQVIRQRSRVIYPRELLHALDSCPQVPGPARFEATPGCYGLDLTLLTRPAASAPPIAEHLNAHRIPISRLQLVSDATAIRQSVPLRCDLTGLALAHERATV